MAAGAQEGSIRFSRFAEECIHIADRIESVDDKAALLIMAQEWIRLADQGHHNGAAATSASEVPGHSPPG
jgi:hypothetical protein